MSSIENYVCNSVMVRLLENYYEGYANPLTSDEIESFDSRVGGSNSTSLNPLLSADNIMEYFKEHYWLERYREKFGDIKKDNVGNWYLEKTSKQG